MSYGYESNGFEVAAQSAASERAGFLRNTYAHLAGAILALIGLEAVLLNTISPAQIFNVLGRSPFGMIGVMVAFMAAGWVAQSFAAQRTSRGLQYLGLALYVVVEAFVILPLFFYAELQFGQAKMHGLAQSAGILSLAIFGGLTAAVLMTGTDYSFLRTAVTVGGFLAMGLVLCGAIFGFSLGIWFSFGMVALLSAFILYETSEVMHRFPTDMYVAAALMLFSSAVTLFYYVFRILMSMQERD